MPVSSSPKDTAKADTTHHTDDNDGDNLKVQLPPQLVNQAHPEIYMEALVRYPNDEAIDQADEKRLVRKLDMRILPLLGVCYFFYVWNESNDTNSWLGI